MVTGARIPQCVHFTNHMLSILADKSPALYHIPSPALSLAQILLAISLSGQSFLAGTQGMEKKVVDSKNFFRTFFPPRLSTLPIPLFPFLVFHLLKLHFFFQTIYSKDSERR